MGWDGYVLFDRGGGCIGRDLEGRVVIVAVIAVGGIGWGGVEGAVRGTGEEMGKLEGRGWEAWTAEWHSSFLMLMMAEGSWA